jgi:Holliday junction resolvasome RuvABC endonuclease subunit
MNKFTKHPRILAIAPSARGFGYAVFEGQDTFIDRGGKRAAGDKNIGSLAKAKDLMEHYQPKVVVMEDTSAKSSRRATRIRELSKEIFALAVSREISVKLFSRETMKKMLFADGEGTKHDMAKIVAGRFSEETGLQLPPKRRSWDNEHPRADVFHALALVMVYRLWRAKRTANKSLKTIVK